MRMVPQASEDGRSPSKVFQNKATVSSFVLTRKDCLSENGRNGVRGRMAHLHKPNKVHGAV